MKNPNIKFRVLIVGRANAGKTSILQRVFGEFAIPPKVQRSTAVLNGTEKRHVVIANGTDDLTIHLGSTGSHKGR